MLHFRFNLLYHPQYAAIDHQLSLRSAIQSKFQFSDVQTVLNFTQTKHHFALPLKFKFPPTREFHFSFHLPRITSDTPQQITSNFLIQAVSSTLTTASTHMSSFLQSSIPICYRWKYLFSPWISLIRDGRRSVVYIIIKIIIRVGRHGAQAIVIDVEHKLDTRRFPRATLIPPFSTTFHPNRPSISPRDR